LRVILLELKQGRVYEKAVSYGCVVAMVGLIAYGSRTIIMVNMGMV
jgi:succinate dehydrogenase / fumarate reductase membrane anchor subunit